VISTLPIISQTVGGAASAPRSYTSKIGKKAKRDEPRTDEVREAQKKSPTYEPDGHPVGIENLKVASERASKDVQDQFLDLMPTLTTTIR
jgi:hypothetical protein